VVFDVRRPFRIVGRWPGAGRCLLRYTSGMALTGRQREMAEVGHLLDRAAGGQGGVLAVTGPRGSGRTELAEAAAREAVRRGFEVLRTAAIRGQPGRMSWAQLLRDIGAPDALAAGLVGETEPLDLDMAARTLASGNRRLLVIDDIDHGESGALQMLQVVAARTQRVRLR
jgi:hypothetical protein